MDLLATGKTWLKDQRYKHMSRTATYRRGDDSVELSASIRRGMADVMDADGTYVTAQAAVIRLRSEDLVLAGFVAFPSVGDRIVYTAAGKLVVCEVLGDGPRALFTADDSGSFKINTKIVSEVDA